MTQTTVKIQGMTCGHCEGRVNTELVKIAGVTDVKASAGDSHAVITSDGTLDSELISQAIITAGYRVVQ